MAGRAPLPGVQRQDASLQSEGPIPVPPVRRDRGQPAWWRGSPWPAVKAPEVAQPGRLRVRPPSVLQGTQFPTETQTIKELGCPVA